VSTMDGQLHCLKAVVRQSIRVRRHGGVGLTIS
jgi:hypothetical protein